MSAPCVPGAYPSRTRRAPAAGRPGRPTVSAGLSDGPAAQPATGGQAWDDTPRGRVPVPVVSVLQSQLFLKSSQAGIRGRRLDLG